MKKGVFKTGRLAAAMVGVLVCIFSFSLSAVALGAITVPLPSVDIVDVDLPTNSMMIYGKGFIAPLSPGAGIGGPAGAGTPPQVFLGGTALVVTAYSSTQINATLPEGIADGSYRLIVQAANSTQYALFEVTIGATGLTGPQGPQGVQGPIGPVGLQGPQGVQGSQGIQGPAGPTGASGTSVWPTYYTVTNSFYCAALSACPTSGYFETYCNDPWDEIISASYTFNGVLSSMKEWSVIQQSTVVAAKTQFWVDNWDWFDTTTTVTLKCLGLRAKP
ncbi:MAG: collagen-like protein [Nitrospirae bacterium]|nr:collagen-like protein [Nitrospirota bacterium]